MSHSVLSIFCCDELRPAEKYLICGALFTKPANLSLFEICKNCRYQHQRLCKWRHILHFLPPFPLTKLPYMEQKSHENQFWGSCFLILVYCGIKFHRMIPSIFCPRSKTRCLAIICSEVVGFNSSPVHFWLVFSG